MINSIHPARRWCLAAGLCLAAFAVSAADEKSPRAYAVISLVADELRVIGQEPTTGSVLSRNGVATTPLPFDVLELSALKAATAAVLKADSRAKVAPVKMTEPLFYEMQADFIDGKLAKLPEAMLKPLRSAPVTHLLLLTRFRDDARLTTANGTLGTGKLEGVGYYVDLETRMRRVDSNAISVGYIAPYVYIRASVIDLKSLAVERTKTSTWGLALAAAGSTAGSDVWAMMDDAAKINRLRDALETQITQLVPVVMGVQ